MFRRTERGTRIVAAIIGVLLAVLVGQLALHRPGKSLVSASYDIPFLVHTPENKGLIRIVYLDQSEGEFLDRRPQARLLDKLADAGASAVVYDVIFDLPSKDPEVDKAFADSIRRFRGVDADGNPIPGQTRRHVFLACGRETFHQDQVLGERLIPPTDVLLEAADDFGIVAFDDEGYLVRKVSTGTADEPSLIWKSATALGARLDEKDRLDIRWINFLGPPPDPEKKSSTGPIASRPASGVLEGPADAGFFGGRVVVVGGKPGIVGEALGKDLFSTPFHRFQMGGKLPFMSGVEVQATGLSNLLAGNWLMRSGHHLDLTLVAIVGVLVGAGLTFLRPFHAIVLSVTLMILFALAGVVTVHYGRTWFPWTVPAFAQIPVALVWGVASHSYIERFFRLKLSAEQAAIRAAFAKYLSPQMLDRLTLEGYTTNLGGEKVEAAMMFTDLESFTDMCEKVGDPERIVDTLNHYFERVTTGIFDYDGIIIKYIGDAIYAAWGAPIPDRDAALNATRAAWNLHQQGKLRIDGMELRTRIGIHLGEVVAGNIGSTRRVDYTLIGDAVNLAARLEGLNKMFGTSILISDDVQSRLKGEFVTRKVGKFQVKGRKEAVGVHELLGPAPQDHESTWMTLYQQALSALDANQSQQAFDLFTAADQARGTGGDGPSRFWIARLHASDPIPDGVFEMKEK